MFGLAVGLLLAEGAVRVLRPGPPVCVSRRFEPRAGIPFTRIENGPIAYQANTTFASVYDPGCDVRGYLGGDGRVTYEINEYGMRGPAVRLAKGAEVFRVVCLGDSITFGEGVRYPDTYPARLERLLGPTMPGRRVEVLNAGVQGYGTKEAAAFYLLRCAAFRPDVVILGFFLNDVVDSGETIRQSEAMVKDYVPSLPGRISMIWERLERRRRARRLQQEYFDEIRRSFNSPRWGECKEVLKGLGQVGREDGFSFVVVIFPVMWELNEGYPFRDLHAEVANACGEAGLACLDLLEVYQGRRAEDLWVHPTDQHPNEIAHGLAAERIAWFLAEPPTGR